MAVSGCDTDVTETYIQTDRQTDRGWSVHTGKVVRVTEISSVVSAYVVMRAAAADRGHCMDRLYYSH